MEKNSNGVLPIIGSAFDLISKIPQGLHKSIKVNFKDLLKNDHIAPNPKPLTMLGKVPSTDYEASLEKQLQAWRSNPSWSNQPPEIKVSVPKGSLCNLNVKFKAGLPPDAIFDIIIDPENKRVFKSIKEVISRKVIIDEGSRQVVELEQSAIWRFLWLSGTLSVHVFVDQDRKNHTIKFKQGRTGFMKRFEGCWKIEPIFIDRQFCPSQDGPKALSEYESSTGGKGRVGSAVSLEQLIQPVLLPPPPISWYLRGITTKTTEMLINDLLIETTRLRRVGSDCLERERESDGESINNSDGGFGSGDIKERWKWRRRRGTRRPGF